ncbi:MAG: helix-turn-helix domain-containing protein [Deltaproteobacteria bacterium]|nr:helix-turn-helix domain-containing protein [Deltaproteobacteria bacterium]
MEKLYTLYQVSRIFRVDYQTVWRWVRAGRLAAFKTPGNQWRVRASEVENHLGG